MPIKFIYNLMKIIQIYILLMFEQKYELYLSNKSSNFEDFTILM